MVVEHRREQGGFRRARRGVLQVRGGEFPYGVRLGVPGLIGDPRLPRRPEEPPVSGEAVYVRALASRGGGADAP